MYINKNQIVTVEIRTRPTYEYIDSGQGPAIVPKKELKYDVVVTDSNKIAHIVISLDSMEAAKTYCTVVLEVGTWALSI